MSIRQFMKRAVPAFVAEELRQLARKAEAVEAEGEAEVSEFFTCREIGWRLLVTADATLANDVRTRYEDAFGFDRWEEDTEADLWNSEDCASIRVMLLCFAAAMAETGDL
jgi:hypothetical protein